MLFKPFFFQETNEVNHYLIGCEETREVFLIDAGDFTPDYEAFLREHDAKITGLFLTHFHWDHDQELVTVLKHFDVPVYSMTGKTPNGVKVCEGDSIQIGKLNNRIYQTTGHTPDNLTWVIEDRIAFVGDAIFAGSIGGTANEELQREEMENIRTKIFTLPDGCLLCSGHGPITTVGIEKYNNPFFV